MAPIFVPLDQSFSNSFLLFMLGALDPSRQGGRLPHILSVSDGVCGSRYTRDHLRLGRRLLTQAAALGITTLAASGDLGFQGCFINKPGAMFPSSSPLATSVGGTDLSLTTGNEIADQVVWSTFAAQPDQGVGSGGGPSKVWRRPAFSEPQASAPASARRPHPAQPPMSPRWPRSHPASPSTTRTVAAGGSAGEPALRRHSQPRSWRWSSSRNATPAARVSARCPAALQARERTRVQLDFLGHNEGDELAPPQPGGWADHGRRFRPAGLRPRNRTRRTEGGGVGRCRGVAGANTQAVGPTEPRIAKIRQAYEYGVSRLGPTMS